MKGFFSKTITKQPLPLIPKCGSCGLYKGCQSPKMPHTGAGRMGVLIVAEAPGKEEDANNIQLCGKTGRYLEKVLRSLDIDMRTDCWLTNALICRPPNNKIPNDNMVDYCRPNLTKTIRELEPRIIIPLGGTAIRSLIGPLWKEDIGLVERWLGWKIPNHNPNAWICPNWHPSYVTRLLESNDARGQVCARLFKRYLQEAFELKKRPWKEVPNFEQRLIMELDPKRAAEHIMLFTESDAPVLAFDYETTHLRPDAPGAEIVCCSISNGHKSVAFPWMGPAVRAMRSFIMDKKRKAGWNIKFEERWTRRHLGIGVRNWAWDGMLATHWMDNRASITGLKFQSYVRLGVEDYDSHIKPFLKAAGANQPNRIKEIPIRDLLKYCAMDSLLEAILAKLQRKECGLC